MDGFVVIFQAVSRTLSSAAFDGTSIRLIVPIMNIIASGRQVASIFHSDASTLFASPLRRTPRVLKLLENAPRAYANQAFAVLTALRQLLVTSRNPGTFA